MPLTAYGIIQRKLVTSFGKIGNLMETEYRAGPHCKYLLKAHLIFVVKYRKSLLTGEMDDRMKQILFEVSQGTNFAIETMETDKDHVHILLDYEPSVAISSIVNRLKGMSTNRIWKQKNEDFEEAVLEREYVLV